MIFAFLAISQIACRPSPLLPEGQEEDASLAANSSPVNETSAPVATAVFLPTKSALENAFYVAVTGDDEFGEGSVEAPWASITHAVNLVPDGATIFVLPGTYNGRVNLKRTFVEGITIVSSVPYQARLRHFESVVTCYFCQGISLEGFDIAHLDADVERYVIQIQDLSEDRSGGKRVTLRNNILHDSYNNDILKINNGADQIVVEGNIFYNQAGPDSHIDINSVTNVTVQDNIFFNDFGGSNRPMLSTASFIVIKDSNGEEDANLGSNNIVLRRNIFLNWQGMSGSTFIVVGEDKVPYYQAFNVLIENNLMLGNSPEVIRAAFMAKGVRDIVFRHNTIVGDLPGRTFAIRLGVQEQNLPNQNITFYNNIWSDPTGTMGIGDRSQGGGFADAPAEATLSFVLRNNLYWNGPNVIPFEENEDINYTDDEQRIIADPFLQDGQEIILPRWLPNESQFADGSLTIEAAFERLVMAYGATAVSSPAIDKAAVEFAAEEDILGNPRGIPDIGAYEFPGSS